jgi:superfamily I DNA/RNA helicase
MESGEYRVFGPPGTGKTHYRTRQIARAVETTLPRKIAVVSFTKAAAEEIASRVDVCNPGCNPDGETGVKVGTLHSFCYHALEAGEIADTPKTAFER